MTPTSGSRWSWGPCVRSGASNSAPDDEGRIGSRNHDWSEGVSRHGRHGRRPTAQAGCGGEGRRDDEDHSDVVGRNAHVALHDLPAEPRLFVQGPDLRGLIGWSSWRTIYRVQTERDLVQKAYDKYDIFV